MVGRVEYDPETDRCVGFVLSIDQDGLPIVDSFLATSFAAINSMFENGSISKYAYIYMAQPLGCNIPPFILACLGTDNKFTAKHVLQRWSYICSKRGISVISFGGDSDSRLMKAMRVSTLLLTPAQDPLHGNQPNYSPCAAFPKSWNKWFCIVQKPVLFVQDTVHLAVKLKSRLLNPNVTLKMGPNCEAGAYHLVTLRTKLGKEEHFLRERDINHKDRQNFDAVMHIIYAAHLLDRITGAAATKCYIELIQNITDSYLDKSYC